MVAKARGRDTIKQELGAMRSFASQAAHQCPDVNEEKFFADVAEAYLKGISEEVGRIFGPTKAKRLLDPFVK